MTALRRWACGAAGLGLGAACLAGGLVPARAAGGSASPDSLAASSARLDSLAAVLSRNWVTRSFTRYIFQPGSHPLQEQAAVQPAVDFFAPYRGAIIRRITMMQLDVFVGSELRTGDALQRTLDKVGQALHADTREGVVRKYFLVQPGERLDPDALADTERLLRGTSFLREAEIVPLEVEGSVDSVDLLVVTRDRWSLGVDVKVNSLSRADVRLADRNFGGWGHTAESEFQIDTEANPVVGLVAGYRVDNLYGTFVRNRYELRSTDRETAGRFELARERVAPQIRTTGALDVAIRDLEAWGPAEPERAFLESRLWLGRAFPVGEAPPGGVSRAAIVPAAACEGIDFWERPDSVSADVNYGYHDRLRLLSSVSFTRSEFRKGRLITGYGRTEDIPEGVLAALTGGVEFGEFETRGYGSAGLQAGKYTGAGYFAGGATLGAFLCDRSWEDGTADVSGRWMSGLLVRHRYGFRQFAVARYTYGFERRAEDLLFLNDDTGLDALSGTALGGRERLVGGLESVLFTPWNAFGFRCALFADWRAGSVGPKGDSFLRSAYTSTLGFGVRLHNTRLILDPLELRFSFALHTPEGTSIEAFDFGNLHALEFPGFDPGPPAVADFR